MIKTFYPRPLMVSSESGISMPAMITAALKGTEPPEFLNSPDGGKGRSGYGRLSDMASAGITALVGAIEAEALTDVIERSVPKLTTADVAALKGGSEIALASLNLQLPKAYAAMTLRQFTTQIGSPFSSQSRSTARVKIIEDWIASLTLAELDEHIVARAWPWTVPPIVAWLMARGRDYGVVQSVRALDQSNGPTPLLACHAVQTYPLLGAITASGVEIKRAALLLASLTTDSDSQAVEIIAQLRGIHVAPGGSGRYFSNPNAVAQTLEHSELKKRTDSIMADITRTIDVHMDDEVNRTLRKHRYRMANSLERHNLESFWDRQTIRFPLTSPGATFGTSWRMVVPLQGVLKDLPVRKALKGVDTSANSNRNSAIALIGIRASHLTQLAALINTARAQSEAAAHYRTAQNGSSAVPRGKVKQSAPDMWRIFKELERESNLLLGTNAVLGDSQVMTFGAGFDPALYVHASIVNVLLAVTLSNSLLLNGRPLYGMHDEIAKHAVMTVPMRAAYSSYRARTRTLGLELLDEDVDPITTLLVSAIRESMHKGVEAVDERTAQVINALSSDAIRLAVVNKRLKTLGADIFRGYSTRTRV